MSFGNMKRRGLRGIVSTSAPVNGKVDLLLACGHTVTSRAGNHRYRVNNTALCRVCARTDGQQRDAMRSKVSA